VDVHANLLKGIHDNIWVMLTSIPEALVKEAKKKV